MEWKIGDLDRYAFCDPAGGKRRQEIKRVRARSAIVTIAVDSPNQRVFVLNAWAERCSTDRLVEKIFELAQQYTPKLFGIEANAMQALFADTVIREARNKGLRIPLTAVNQPTNVEKEWRIRTTLQPMLVQGRIFLQKSQLELISELNSFPTGQTVDIVDALCSAVRMVPQKHSKQQVADEDASTMDYLRKTGAAASEIERRFPQGGRMGDLRDNFRSGKL